MGAGPRLGVWRHARRVPTSAACMALALCLQRYAESIDLITRKTYTCCGLAAPCYAMYTLFRPICKVCHAEDITLLAKTLRFAQTLLQGSSVSRAVHGRIATA